MKKLSVSLTAQSPTYGGKMDNRYSVFDYYCTIKDGHFKAKDPSAPEKLHEFAGINEGRDVYVKLEVIKDAVSLAQFRFFHGPLLNALCEATGEMDKEMMKRYCKSMFLIDVVEVLGKPTVEIPSLRDISRDAMALFIDKCIMLLADNGGSVEKNEIDKYETIINEATKQLKLF